MEAEAAAPVPAGVDLGRLRGFFERHVQPPPTGPLRAALLRGGRSNLTYLITDGASRWVLRRPPLGHVLPTAHDMSREYRVLRALVGTAVPVPTPLAFCDDAAVNGAPFYVMDMVDGQVVRTADDGRRLSADQARACSTALVDVLARIHAVDPGAVGLADFGRPDGYLERQVRRWGQQWERSRTRELPAVDEVARRLRAALPERSEATVVHGDYRLDNTILDTDDPGRILAVVDWEMATLGDPLADLGLMLVYGSPHSTRVVTSGDVLRSNRGFMSETETVEAYARASGRDLADLDFYVVLGYFKLAVVAEGIYARYLQGKTVGDDGTLGSAAAGIEKIGQSVPALIDAACDVADRSSLHALRG